MHSEPAAAALGRLQSESGRTLLLLAAQLIAEGADDLQVISRLRRLGDDGLAGAALQTSTLRIRARHKFGAAAEQMFFTRDALEQASRADVSAHRAARLAGRGVTRVIDAGCGIGADALALGRAGIQVTAVERDAQVFAALQGNVVAAGLQGIVEPVYGDAEQVIDSAGPGWTVFFDPARRSDGRRIFDPEQSEPPLSYLLVCVDRGLPVVAKMSPGLPYAAIPAGWEAEWVSTTTEQGRSVVEACLWSPSLASSVRRATVLPSGSWVSGSPDRDLPVGELGRYIYEPDGAVIRAELIGQALGGGSARLLHRDLAYVTSDEPLDSVLFAGYEVLESVEWSKRAAVAALRTRAPRDLTIKKRGVDIDPMTLRKEMLRSIKDRSGEPLTLVIFRVGRRTTAAITRPLRQSTP